MSDRYFTPKLFHFLKDLAENNNREWFTEHQDGYERYVREPALDFITDFAGPLRSISEHFVADPRKVGGSLFRIHRDVRFGADKTPYKENTGMQFRHTMAKDVHSPGYYINIQPGECFVGLGLWHPETKVAYVIRDRIAEDPAGWKKATRAKRFTDALALGGESLVRPPKGFDPDHPLIADLKRKDFMASTKISQRTMTSDHFMTDLADTFKRGTPFMRFLCQALDLPF